MSRVANDSKGNMTWIDEAMEKETSGNEVYYCPSENCCAKMHVRRGKYPCFVSNAIEDHKNCYYASIYREFGKKKPIRPLSYDELLSICGQTKRTDQRDESEMKKDKEHTKPPNAREIYLSVKQSEFDESAADKNQSTLLLDDYSVMKILPKSTISGYYFHLFECVLDENSIVEDDFQQITLKAPLVRKNVAVTLCFNTRTMGYSATLQSEYNRLTRLIAGKKERMVVVLGQFWAKKNYFQENEEHRYNVQINNARQIAVFKPGNSTPTKRRLVQ